MRGSAIAGKLRALVVDDDPMMRSIVCDVLLARGFQVEEAADGSMVADRLRRSHVDVLISDVVMPGVSGLEVVATARRISPNTSTIIMTGDRSLATARGATRSGADDYLPKPFGEDDLLAAVDASLSRRAKEREEARQRELADLFRLSQDVQDAEDPWSMLRLAATTALVQTVSDVGCLAATTDGELWPFTVGPVMLEGDTRALADDDLMSVCAQHQSPILLTEARVHPLSGVISDIRHHGSSILLPCAELLVCPMIVRRGEVGAIAMGRFDAERPYTRSDFQLISVLAAQCSLLLRNATLLDELQRAYVGTVQSMARTVEARDKYTHGHSRRVSELCLNIARKMNFGGEQMEQLRIAADLHDIGKLSVPDSVLNKPGKLTDEEWQAIRAHPVVGAEVLAPASFLSVVRPLVLHHHERWDGTGYPDHLIGADLDCLASVLIVADSWDAMTSDRPYRPALTTEAALREIERGSKTQFHPDVAAAIVALYAGAA
jgi:response regulator RpfG family c-di-GMP phosphodiesterase